MTDNEIIKALKLCIDDECRCGECPYFCLANESKSCGEAHGIDMLNLINRQKAEIERLNKEVDRLSQCVLYHDGQIADAIKEFAERLQEKYSVLYAYRGGLIKTEIDNLVKEMTEEKL